VEKDIEICKAVRHGVGDDMTLMLDSMWAYGYEEAMRVGRAIEVDDKGLVYAPKRPGLGYDIDWELVEREKVDVIK